jgi:hypothetical protein
VFAVTWPLECWINGCAFPRVDGTHCARHAWRDDDPVVAEPPPVVRVVRDRTPWVKPAPAQDAVFDLLQARGPSSLGELARLRGVSTERISDALRHLVARGRAERIRHGVYAAVTS